MKGQQKQFRLILASGSPRRKFLLAQVGLTFDIIPSTVDETLIGLHAPEDQARLLAEKKAAAVARRYPDAYVIGADTIVCIDNALLGKPASTAEARAMLKRLNGRTHKVLTGYAVRCEKQKHTESKTVCTVVRFKSLTDAEIEWYLDTKESFDKAGAYAIQGQGAFMVATISGSYTNVVGLPMSDVVDSLNQLGLTDHFRKNAFETRP